MASVLLSSVFTLLLLRLLNLTSIHVSAADHLIYEEGYIVTTVLDGNKLNINPHSILPLPGSSDLLILDSSASSVYTASFSTGQNGVIINRLAGTGVAGFSDGDLAAAKFNKPKSFAVDLKGNVYVADPMNNHTIRKISQSGVTTIAGGSKKAGHADGPAQNALFSDDFELVFIPERCALMISDRGNMLVRQISLNAEDCAQGSQSVVGTTSAWVLGLAVSCLLGLIVGFVSHPCIVVKMRRSRPSSIQTDMEALPNQSGDTSNDALLRHQKRNC